MKCFLILISTVALASGFPSRDYPYPIHPGVGAIYKGPNSETIIEGPGGSKIISEESKAGAIELSSADPARISVDPAPTHANPAFIDQTQTFVAPAQSFVHQPQTFDDQAATFVDQSQIFADRAATFAGPQTFGDPAATFADQPQTFVNPATAFVDQSQTYVDPAATFANQPQTFVDQPQTFVDRSATFVDQPHSFVDHSQNVAHRAQSFVNRAQTFVDQGPVLVEPAGILPVAPTILLQENPIIVPDIVGRDPKIIEEHVIIGNKVISVPKKVEEDSDLIGPSGTISTRGGDIVISGPASTTIKGGGVVSEIDKQDDVQLKSVEVKPVIPPIITEAKAILAPQRAVYAAAAPVLGINPIITSGARVLNTRVAGLSPILTHAPALIRNGPVLVDPGAVFGNPFAFPVRSSYGPLH